MPDSTLQQLRTAHIEEQRALGYRMWCGSGHKNIIVSIRKYMYAKRPITRVERRLAELCNLF